MLEKFLLASKLSLDFGLGVFNVDQDFNGSNWLILFAACYRGSEGKAGTGCSTSGQTDHGEGDPSSSSVSWFLWQ